MSIGFVGVQCAGTRTLGTDNREIKISKETDSVICNATKISCWMNLLSYIIMAWSISIYFINMRFRLSKQSEVPPPTKLFVLI